MTSVMVGCRYCGSTSESVAVESARLGIVDPVCCECWERGD